MRMLSIAIFGLIGCRADDGTLRIRLQGTPPAGVTCRVEIKHFSETTFEQVTKTYPESDFAGAVIQGPSFDKPADVYVLTFHVQNDTAKNILAPDVYLLHAQALEGEPETLVRAKKRSLAPGAHAIHFFWDPGRRLSGVTARLSFTFE